MNIKTSLPTILASAALLLGSPLFAQHGGGDTAKAEATKPAGKLVPVGEKEAAWAAKARTTYPLDVCVTSDEKLGSMGQAAEYAYRVDGSPDRLVVFCCEGCEEDFLGEPAKYLAKIDAAQKAKDTPSAGAKTAPKSQH